RTVELRYKYRYHQSALLKDGSKMKESSNSNESVWHFYDLLNCRVLDQEGNPLGRIADLVADLREHDPPITGLIVSGSDKNRRHVPWSWVEELLPGTVKLHLGDREVPNFITGQPGEILLGKGLLDKQIVDTGGAKVVRVNDLQLRRRNGVLVLSKVDVGMRGLLRRLGLLRVVSTLIRYLFDYNLPDNLIAWRLVQPVFSSDLLKLKFSQARLSRLHPADLADIIEDLDRPERDRVFKALDIDLAAEVLEEAEPEVQIQLIQHLTTEKASDVLEQMSLSEATDLLQELEEPHAQTLLKEMEPGVAQDVRCLLVHDEETAGGMMTTSFFSQPPNVTVNQALEALRKEASDLDLVYYTYVEDQLGHLLGVLNLRELLTSDQGATLEMIMEKRIVSVGLEDKKSDIADLFVKYGLRAFPVVDQEGRIHGVIRFKALVDAVAPHLRR
ncbi:MAG: CBS domain-containing protein, partial [Syntrophales bacterium LBB04]|nr:CBS domain-containing protein [Syntrophales bacterium LBB04]